jgi:hypothetical protein
MTTIDRRTLLGLGVGAGVVLLAGSVAGWELTGPGSAPTAPRAAPSDRRRLLVLEMAGGSDGLSMVVPYADPSYRKLRPATAIDAAKVHRIDAAVGFHPELETLARQGAAVVAGVGAAKPDLSHFEILYRRPTADPDSTVRPATGFLGRLCDQLGDPTAPAVGVSLGLGATQSLACERVTTISVYADNAGVFPAYDDDGGIRDAWLAAQRAMAHPDSVDTALLATHPSRRRDSASVLRRPCTTYAGGRRIPEHRSGGTAPAGGAPARQRQPRLADPARADGVSTPTPTTQTATRTSWLTSTAQSQRSETIWRTTASPSVSCSPPTANSAAAYPKTTPPGWTTELSRQALS